MKALACLFVLLFAAPAFGQCQTPAIGGYLIQQDTPRCGLFRRARTTTTRVIPLGLPTAPAAQCVPRDNGDCQVLSYLVLQVLSELREQQQEALTRDEAEETRRLLELLILKSQLDRQPVTLPASQINRLVR